MELGLKYLFDRKPEINAIIFAGKGGLGKTTLSSALAYHISQNMDKRVLCFSTDPQASLSDIFEQNVFGKGEVEIAKKLSLLEIDADSKIASYTDSIKQKIKDLYKIDEIPREIEDYIDSASSDPAFYESAVYDGMIDVVSQKKYDFHIFDMPPFGHGIRMISIADILSQWVEKITDTRRQALEYEQTAKRMKREKPSKDSIIVGEEEFVQELESIGQRITSFHDLLSNTQQTAFIMVLTPEKMSIVDTERAIKMFEDLGLTVTGIVINQIYPVDLLKDPNISEFLKNRIIGQKPLIKEIFTKFGDLVVGVIPMFNKEPKGISMIDMTSKELWVSSMDISTTIFT